MRRISIYIFLLQLFFVDLHGQDKLLDTQITIQESEITVGKVLEIITAQTQFNFSYNSRIIDLEDRISLFVRNASIEEVLIKLGEQINIDYTIIDDQIILNRTQNTLKRPASFFTLSGFIKDEATGESLIGATVAIEGTIKGAVTNEFGYYVLELEQGKHALSYSYVGYESQKIEIQLSKDEQQNATLKSVSIELPNVVVGRPLKHILAEKHIGQNNFPVETLKNMPKFGGESSLIKSLQALPGIQMHSDGSAFMFARGGERDQNLIIIDDAPIYNPAHLFGFYSIVVPDFAKDVKVYKSDIPTNLGDRLSSIISIRTKDGNLNDFELRGSVDPLLYQFSIETPVSKEKGSIFASLRRSNFEWLYRRDAPDLDLSFADVNFKWNHRFNENNRLFFTTIISGDRFNNNNSIDGSENWGIGWGNFAATLRWNHIFGPKLFSNTTIYTGNYGYRLSLESNFWQSSLGTLSLKSDFTHYPTPNFKSKFGIELQAYFIDPGSFAIDSSIAILPKVETDYTRKSVLYYQGELDLSEKLKFNAGLRVINWANVGPATYFQFDQQYTVSDTISVGQETYNNYFNIDPRLSLMYQFSNTSSVKLSYGLYHQYLQLISNSIAPFTSLEVWLPSGPNIQPQSAQQMAISYLNYFEKAGLEISAAAYYKKLDNQIDYKDHAEILLNPLLEGELRFGTIDAYGLELFLKRELGRLNGWLSYTYSRVFRKTRDLNEGKVYPAFQDRPHELSLLLNYQLSKRFLLSTYWTSFSGSTFSSPTGFYRYNDQTVPVYAEKNNDRLPAYHRFDFGLKYRLNKVLKQQFQHSLTLSMYNTLAHKNVIAVNFNKIASEGLRPVIKSNLLSQDALNASQLFLIRSLPSLTYQFKY